MIYPDVFVQDWAIKYDITVPTKVCDACLQPMPCRPFLMRGYAGLECFCPCGKNQRKAMSMVSTLKSEYDKWLEMLS